MPNSIASVWKGARELGGDRLLFLGALTLGHLVVHWYTQLISLTLPLLKAHLHLSNVQVGGITTSQQAVSSATNLPLGYVADSFPKWGALILGSSLVAFGLAYFLMGVASSYILVLVGAGFVGLAMALWHPAALGHLSLRFPERRGMALAVHGVGASVGDTAAPVAVGAIIVLVSWKPVLVFHLIPALLFALVLWRGLGRIYQEAGPKRSFRSYLSGLRDMVANRQVLAVMASNTLMTMARLGILTFLPIYIKETLGYSSFILGLYLTLLNVMGIVSQPLMGIISDRYGRKVVLVPSFVAMALLYAALAYATSGIQLGLVIGTLGIFFYALLNITQTAVMDVVGEGVQSSTMGVMSLFSQPFTLSSPILAGYLVETFGIKSSFWYAAAAMVLAATILLPVRFRRVPLLRPSP